MDNKPDNLTLWSERMLGARLLLESLVSRYKICSKERCRDEQVYVDAIIRLALSSHDNMALFMENKAILFRNHKTDKKGKLTSVEAYFGLR